MTDCQMGKTCLTALHQFLMTIVMFYILFQISTKTLSICWHFNFNVVISIFYIEKCWPCFMTLSTVLCDLPAYFVF